MTCPALLSALPVEMVAILSCFVFEGAAYNVIYLGRILPAVRKKAMLMPCAVHFNLFWALALVSYMRAHAADPGRIPKQWEEFVRSVGVALPLTPARPEWQPGQVTFCERCNIPRPERAHHCASCRMCVLRMDHHCEWINNCVGFNNHKFFILTVIYAWLASIVAVGTSIPELWHCIAELSGFEDFRISRDLQKTDVLTFFISGILSVFFTVLLTPMLLVHLPLVAQNKTAIEANYKNMPNPFDQGSRISNLEEIFGTCGPDWAIPVQPWRPLSDGLAFLPREQTSMPASYMKLPSDCNEPVEGCGNTSFAAERLWRQRYRVRRQVASVPSEQTAFGSGPLSSLARWWNGSADLDSPSAGSSPSKRSL